MRLGSLPLLMGATALLWAPLVASIRVFESHAALMTVSLLDALLLVGLQQNTFWKHEAPSRPEAEFALFYYFTILFLFEMFS